MKKIVPVIFLALSLTSCGKMKDVKNYSNNSNIKSVISKEDKNSSSNVEDSKDIKNQKYDDLSFIDCYKDIIDSKIPYRIDSFGGENHEWYLNEVDSNGALYFNIIDHKDFDYPLLVLSKKMDGVGIYSIVQYVGSGNYRTFNELQMGQTSVVSDYLYKDNDGNLYIFDDVMKQIIGINKVDDKLLANYIYKPGSKGYGSLMVENFDTKTGERTSEISKNFPNGVDSLGAMMIDPQKEEKFTYEEFDKLKNELKPIDMLGLSEEEFYKKAKEFGYKDNNEVKDSDKKDQVDYENIEDTDEYKKLDSFIRENINLYTNDNGVEFVYIGDYDNNGKLAAFVVGNGENEDERNLFFIDENMQITKACDLNYFNISVKNNKLIKAGDDQYLSIITNNGGPKTDSFIFSVKNNKVYEPDISGEVMEFYQSDDDIFVDETNSLGENPKGSVRKGGKDHYKYNKETRQFEKLD